MNMHVFIMVESVEPMGFKMSSLPKTRETLCMELWWRRSWKASWEAECKLPFCKTIYYKKLLDLHFLLKQGKSLCHQSQLSIPKPGPELKGGSQRQSGERQWPTSRHGWCGVPLYHRALPAGCHTRSHIFFSPRSQLIRQLWISFAKNWKMTSEATVSSSQKGNSQKWGTGQKAKRPLPQTKSQGRALWPFCV